MCLINSVQLDHESISLKTYLCSFFSNSNSLSLEATALCSCLKRLNCAITWSWECNVLPFLLPVAILQSSKMSTLIDAYNDGSTCPVQVKYLLDTISSSPCTTGTTIYHIVPLRTAVAFLPHGFGLRACKWWSFFIISLVLIHDSGMEQYPTIWFSTTLSITRDY